MYKLYLTCNWDNNEQISDHWKTKLDTSVPVEITTNRDEADFYIVFNKPNDAEKDFDYKTKKTILIRMEPFMKKNTSVWGEWSDPDCSLFLQVISPPESLNFVEWHLDKTFDELSSTTTTAVVDEKRDDNAISVIISDRYQDEGQIKRIDFVRYLQENCARDIQLHIYGRGDLSRFGIKNKIKELPPYCKDEAILSYKYHFNCENSFSMNYITEKLYDGILGGAFTFYAGSTNVRSVYPKGGYEHINLDNFETAAQTMIARIKDGAYEKERDRIQDLKVRILNRYTFSHRIHDVITGVPFQPLYGLDEIEDVIQYQAPPTPPPKPLEDDESIKSEHLDILVNDHSQHALSALPDETTSGSAGNTGLAQDCIDQLNMVLYELNETVIKLNAIVQSLV